MIQFITEFNFLKNLLVKPSKNQSFQIFLPSKLNCQKQASIHILKIAIHKITKKYPCWSSCSVKLNFGRIHCGMFLQQFPKFSEQLVCRLHVNSCFYIAPYPLNRIIAKTYSRVENKIPFGQYISLYELKYVGKGQYITLRLSQNSVKHLRWGVL